MILASTFIALALNAYSGEFMSLVRELTTMKTSVSLTFISCDRGQAHATNLYEEIEQSAELLVLGLKQLGDPEEKVSSFVLEECFPLHVSHL